MGKLMQRRWMIDLTFVSGALIAACFLIQPKPEPHRCEAPPPPPPVSDVRPAQPPQPPEPPPMPRHHRPARDPFHRPEPLRIHPTPRDNPAGGMSVRVPPQHLLAGKVAPQVRHGPPTASCESR